MYMALTSVSEERKVPEYLLDEVSEEQVEIRVDHKLEERNLLKALGDEVTRTILLSMIEEPKSAIDITREKKIPISSVYRKIHWLENAHLIKVKGFVITGDGKKYHLYQSRIKTLQVLLMNNGVEVEFTNNDGRRYSARREYEIPVQ